MRTLGSRPLETNIYSSKPAKNPKKGSLTLCLTAFPRSNRPHRSPWSYMRVRVRIEIPAAWTRDTWSTRACKPTCGRQRSWGIDPLRITRNAGRESRVQVENERRRGYQGRVQLPGRDVDAGRGAWEIGEIKDVGRMATFDYSGQLARSEGGGDGAVAFADLVATVAGHDGWEDGVYAWRLPTIYDSACGPRQRRW